MAEESTLTRTEKLLALLLLETGKAGQQERCVQLNRAGIGNSEIAGLLGISASSVGSHLHASKKSTAKKTTKTAKKTTKSTRAK